MLQRIVATGVERAQQGQKKDTTKTCTTATMVNAPKMNVVGKRVIHSQERVPQAPSSVMNTMTTDSTATMARQKKNAACVDATTTSTALALPVKCDEKNTIGITVATTATVLTNAVWMLQRTAAIA